MFISVVALPTSLFPVGISCRFTVLGSLHPSCLAPLYYLGLMSIEPLLI